MSNDDTGDTEEDNDEPEHGEETQLDGHDTVSWQSDDCPPEVLAHWATANSTHCSEVNSCVSLSKSCRSTNPQPDIRKHMGVKCCVKAETTPLMLTVQPGRPQQYRGTEKINEFLARKICRDLQVRPASSHHCHL